jgi:hypothetical protein
MSEVFSEILLRGAYGRLYATSFTRRNNRFFGENGDFGVFFSLIEKKLTKKRTANSNFHLIVQFSLYLNLIEH